MRISSIQRFNPSSQPIFQKRQVIEENGIKYVKVPKKDYDLDNILWGVFAVISVFELLATLSKNSR